MSGRAARRAGRCGADLASAVAFLTVVGRGVALRRQAPAWFPVVGAGLGATLGVLWWSAEGRWPPLVVGGLVVAADAGLTGLLHLDGLVDTADGVLPPLERARRLEVMREPTVGAFGVLAAVIVVLLRWSAFASRPQGGAVGAVLLLGGLWTLSRSLMVAAMTRVAPARADGLAVRLAAGGRAGWLSSLLGLVVAAVALVVWSPAAGATVWAVALVAGVGVVGACRRRLGGVTGDVLGAAGVVAETAGLLVAVARW
jgi:adenosylcobinamide-GDP ribazoletransferase